MKGRKAEIHALNGALDKAPPAPVWLPKLAKTKWARVGVCLMETVAGSDLAVPNYLYPRSVGVFS
jgi:phage terminase small subunit